MPSLKRMTAIVFVIATFAGATDPSRAQDEATKKPETVPANEAPAAAQEWTLQSIEAAIKELQANAKIKDEEKKKIEESFKQAQSLLKTAEEWSKRAAGFVQALEAVPNRMKAVKQELLPPVSDAKLPTKPEELTVKSLESRSNSLRTELEAAKKASEEAEQRIRHNAERRRKLPELLSDVRKKQKEHLANPVIAKNNSDDWNLKASAASNAALVRAYAAEIECYEKETSYLNGVGELPALERDYSVRKANALKQSLDKVTERLTIVRRQEAEEDAAEAARARDQQTMSHPVLANIVSMTQGHAESRKKLTATIESAEKDIAKYKKQLDEVKATFERVQQQIKRTGLNVANGQELRRAQSDADSIDRLQSEFTKCARSMDRVQNELLVLEARRSELADQDARIQDTFEREGIPAAEREHLRNELTRLLTTEREIVDGAISDHHTALSRLVELHTALRGLIDETRRFASFAAERTLWLRSAPMIGRGDLRTLVELAPELASQSHWIEVVTYIYTNFRKSLRTTIVVALVVIFWFVAHHSMRRRLKSLGERVEQNYMRTFSLTVRALALTLLLSLFWPTLIYYLGWRMQTGEGASRFTVAVGAGLTSMVAVFGTIEVLRQIFRRRGLAESHFRWHSSAVITVRMNLTLLWPIASVAAFLVGFTEARLTDSWKTSLGRVSFAIGMLSFAYFMYQIMKPTGTVLKDVFANRNEGFAYRLRYLWFIASFSAPIILAVLALEGHYFTALQLTLRLLPSFWGLVAVVVLHAMAVRWLFAARGKLALERAKARRESGDVPSKGKSAGTSDQVDLMTINLHIRRLVGSGLAVSFAFLLWFLWADAMPAFGPVTQYALWNVERERVEIVAKPDGGTQTNRVKETNGVTAIHVAAAIGILWLTFVIAGSVPGLAEVMLFSIFPSDTGARYAATTLIRYLLSVIGICSAASILGIGWSQVQWLVAGMTVGLGFGLQEIFANFVSGLILLFERPIRPGDIVTVGDTTGKVTKIRIRSATILDWSRRELVIPNKEFIVGRVTNWTLTDRSARVQIRVGIAYESDPDEAKRIMLKTAVEHPDVSSDPEPSCLFEEFGESTLNMVLNAFVDDIDDLGRVRHELNATISKAFREHNIECAFPHRDVTVHLSHNEDVLPRRMQKASA